GAGVHDREEDQRRQHQHRAVGQPRGRTGRPGRARYHPPREGVTRTRARVRAHLVSRMRARPLPPPAPSAGTILAVEVAVTHDAIPGGAPGAWPGAAFGDVFDATLLLYLDQNYASRVAKILIGQASHEAFGEVHEALVRATERHAGGTGPEVCVPPSPFHVL